MAMSLLLMVALMGAGYAEQVLEKLKNPVMAELQTPVNGETTPEGQEFYAVLPEDVRYRQWTLPAGTVFYGQVDKVRHSRPVFKGYVVMNVREATLPNGRVFVFDPEKYDDRDKRIYHEDATTLGESFVQQLPYTAVSTGISVPLKYAADMDGWEVFPITMGARMALGAMLALADDDLKGRPLPNKIAIGVWEGTGVPRAYRLLKPDPEPDFQAGEPIALYFDPDGLEDLFRTASGEVAAVQSAEPGQPVSTEAAVTEEEAAVTEQASDEAGQVLYAQPVESEPAGYENVLHPLPAE